MRTLIFACSQDATRLFASFKLGGRDPCFLMGGMPPDMVQREVAKFEANPDAIMVATAAWEKGWRTDCEAGVFFLEGSFANKRQAYERVKSPTVELPTVDQLVSAYGGYGDVQEVIEDKSATGLKELRSARKSLPAPPRE